MSKEEFIMYGIKTDDDENQSFDNIYENNEIIKIILPYEIIYELKFQIHENQSDFYKDYTKTEYFGYLRKGDELISIVQPNIMLFDMCFAGGYKIEV